MLEKEPDKAAENKSYGRKEKKLKAILFPTGEKLCPARSGSYLKPYKITDRKNPENLRGGVWQGIL